MLHAIAVLTLSAMGAGGALVLALDTNRALGPAWLRRLIAQVLP